MNYFWILKKHNSSFNNFGAHVKSIFKKVHVSAHNQFLYGEYEWDIYLYGRSGLRKTDLSR